MTQADLIRPQLRQGVQHLQTQQQARAAQHIRAGSSKGPDVQQAITLGASTT